MLKPPKGGGRGTAHHAPSLQAPNQPAEGGGSLCDLLAQVAPHARITESGSSSLLASRASARILSNMLAQAKGSPRNGVASAAAFGQDSRGRQGGEDEDDDQFLERWNGLFSKGSPLVDGSAKDPFKDDLRRRNKCIWKKNSERPGHHKRYQKRLEKRELHDLEEEPGVGWEPGARAADTREDGSPVGAKDVNIIYANE